MDPFPLDVNCRNTVEIAERVAQAVGVEQVTLGVRGVAPDLREFNTERQLEKALGGILDKLVAEGLDPSQIVILSSSRAYVDRIRYEGGFDGRIGSGEQGKVMAETVHRFKGLESDAVILVLFDGPPDDLRRLAYVGMSRARSLLYVLAAPGVPSSIRWD